MMHCSFRFDQCILTSKSLGTFVFQTSLDLAARFARVRKTFGKPLVQQQADGVSVKGERFKTGISWIAVTSWIAWGCNCNDVS